MARAAYYERDGVVLYHGNAIDVLSDVGEVHLLLTDPPYGINYKTNRSRNGDTFDRIVGDGSDRSAVLKILALAVKKLNLNRHAYIFGPLSSAEAELLRLASPVELIWDKKYKGSGDVAAPWGSQHERITFATYEPSRANRKAGAGRLTAKMRKGSVLSAPKVNQGRHVDKLGRHPNEKPVSILREMIESSSLFGDVVLDPFAGSGSTLVASLVESRRAVGVEIEERYCEIAAKRLEAVRLPEGF